jgi:hypothetical protein
MSDDYKNYREIMDQLLNPIEGKSLDDQTLLQLYESKLVYLENLRARAFFASNRPDQGFFTPKDQQLIIEAIATTKLHLRDAVVFSIKKRIQKVA